MASGVSNGVIEEIPAEAISDFNVYIASEVTEHFPEDFPPRSYVREAS